MRQIRWLLVAVAVSLSTYSGARPPHPLLQPQDPGLLARVECGHGWKAESASVKQIADIIDVPEFHDCQRFIVPLRGELAYDSLFAVYASQTLSSLERRLGPAQLIDTARPLGGGRGRPVARDPAARVRAAFVALVYGDGPYAHLGIARGRNCLYVWRYVEPGHAGVATWFARMIPTYSHDCRDANKGALPTGKDLKVSRRQVADFDKLSDYPPVARWDWDTQILKQYIGVACGAAWCEIFADSLQSSAALPVLASDNRDIRRVRLIKGYYDQQLLAKFETPDHPAPSRIMGTIVPDVRAAAQVMADFDKGPVHVADIGLESALGPTDPVLNVYQQKFNFVQTSITTPAKMYIRSKPSPGNWEAGIVQPGSSTPTLRAVKRRPVDPQFRSKGYQVPGVARWRWMRSDEGSWTRCDWGCCELSNYGF